MSLRHLRLPSGERSVLVAESLVAIPDLWAAAYVATDIRSSGVSDNTVRNKLYGVERGLRFFLEKGEDVRTRALRWEFTTNELAAFADFCRTPSHGAQPNKKPAYLYTSFIAYFVWLGDEPTAEALPERKERLLAKADFEKRAALYKPRDEPGEDRNERLGLTSKQRDLFLRVIIPVAPDNPFGDFAFRNFVVMTLAWLLGLRTGEVLGLKIRDFDFIARTVTIHRRTDDPDDTRRRPAAQKTLPRTLPMSERLTLMVQQLAKEGRSERARLRHPYLVVNRDGNPLDPRGLGKVYAVLRSAHPELSALVHHVLRHDWNDRWREMVKAEGYDPDRSLDEQTYAMGWSHASRMPETYTRRSRRAAANLRLLKMQEMR